VLVVHPYEGADIPGNQADKGCPAYSQESDRIFLFKFFQPEEQLYDVLVMI
jgi:hypothetical protein